jgi:ABC-2 type transport system ATP-binding protein
MPAVLSTRLRRALPRLTRRRIIGGSIALVIVAGLVVWAAVPQRSSWRTEAAMITVKSGPAGDTPISLDTTYYLPNSASAAHPVPAVLLAHGFGGTKSDVVTEAQDLAKLGYAVMTWTAEGFGRSGGQIHLDSPDYEVKDGQRLVDWLAARPEIRKDAPGDPRVGVVGGSYGGGLTLLLAGYDRRIDAIVPSITWNDLATAFLPEATGKPAVDGVFKKSWAGLFFGSGGSTDQLGTGSNGSSQASTSSAGDSAAEQSDPACGRFAKDICNAYLSIATTGRADAAAVALLRRSSPSSVLDRIKAPTLLIQGQADTLFPLSEADANARGIAAAGTPVRVAWFTGGHDGGSGPKSDQNRLNFLTSQWLGHYLKGDGSTPSTSFTYSRITGLDAVNQGLVSGGYSIKDYPGVRGTATTTVNVSGPATQVANPPSGTPAAISSVPLAGALASLANATGGSGLVGDVPGQHATFDSAVLSNPVQVVGSPTVSVRAASPTGEAVLFVKLYDVDQKGNATLPDGLVAPIRLAGLPTDIAQAQTVQVTLPAIVRRIEAGHRLRVVVATSDQAFATPAAPTVYTVALGAASAGTGDVTSPLSLPTVAGDPIASPAVIWRWVLAGLLAAIVIGIVVAVAIARRRAGRADRSVHPDYADTPLVVRGLHKAYDDGFVAVSKVDFTVERGQVVGLLGPNGAGKTTALRVLMGLTRPTGGEVLVFGHRLAAGAPVLSRLGALVEGPGFLPHLSGLANLQTYWRSTGRPTADAGLDEALEIAGLGDAIHRKVHTYSHGMKQRLAIAQAMLGLPELLVLDEPTDGLDPPQIAEMRRVLNRYATGGRAVLVSSHLLAEVEQTCTHVIVVHKGEVVASGLVDDIIGDSPTVMLDVSDPSTARTVLAGLHGVTVTSNGSEGIVADLVDGTARADVVAALVAAGVGVDRVVPRRRLEDAFLALVGDNSRGSGDR